MNREGNGPVTKSLPDIITTTLRLAGSAVREADGIVACFTEDAEVIDEDESRRGRAAIRQWWEGPATAYDDTVELRGSLSWATKSVRCLRLLGRHIRRRNRRPLSTPSCSPPSSPT